MNSLGQYWVMHYGVEIPSRVFVGRMPYDMTEFELNEFFSQYGKVKDAKVITDRQGVSKGFGFVTFESEEEAQQVLSQGRFRYKNSRTINVGKAIRKQGGQFEKANQEYINGQKEVSLLRHSSGDYLLTCNNGMWHTEPLHHHSQMSKPYYSIVSPAYYMPQIPALLPSPGPLYSPHHSTGFTPPPPLPPQPHPPQSYPPYATCTLPSQTYTYFPELQDPSIVDCGGLEEGMNQLSLGHRDVTSPIVVPSRSQSVPTTSKQKGRPRPPPLSSSGGPGMSYHHQPSPLIIGPPPMIHHPQPLPAAIPQTRFHTHIGQPPLINSTPIITSSQIPQHLPSIPPPSCTS